MDHADWIAPAMKTDDELTAALRRLDRDAVDEVLKTSPGGSVDFDQALRMVEERRKFAPLLKDGVTAFEAECDGGLIVLRTRGSDGTLGSPWYFGEEQIAEARWLDHGNGLLLIDQQGFPFVALSPTGAQDRASPSPDQDEPEFMGP